MKKDLTNSRLDRQNILNNEMAIEEIQNKSGVEGIVSIEGCIDSVSYTHLDVYKRQYPYQPYVLRKGLYLLRGSVLQHQVLRTYEVKPAVKYSKC